MTVILKTSPCGHIVRENCTLCGRYVGWAGAWPLPYKEAAERARTLQATHDKMWQRGVDDIKLEFRA